MLALRTAAASASEDTRIQNEARVGLMYANGLEREADGASRNPWIDPLAQGESEGAVMVGFTESQESLMLFG
ncbi:MAG: DUF4214 domain-containing protein [Halomonas sp.]|uniref:DUF4214 domain-containing protein n=1 Tax=Halomonas sp. TaxID=1486246 RepID=UPI002870854A|nr:DUF4214 domain-containing protein [Halomonas sp.]MDR9440880.1 DUF4214 domain-containing protein [Halomonas sp.]